MVCKHLRMRGARQRMVEVKEVKTMIIVIIIEAVNIIAMIII